MIFDQEGLDEIAFIKFKQGDEKYFELIFNLYFKRIVSFCNEFVYDIGASECIAQEAFINLWQSRKKIHKPGGIRSFLYTSAKSKCLNHLRNLRIREKHEKDMLFNREIELNTIALDSFNFDEFDFNELENRLNEALDKLTPKCREVFIKSRFEQKKNTEIAEDLNISVKAVEANITRALKQLRLHLSEYFPAVILHVIMKIM